MVTITDASIATWSLLRTGAAAATFRGLVMLGADHVLEAGDLTESVLETAVAARRAAETPTKVLAAAIQDAGERPDSRLPGHYLQYVVVRLYDRGRGYRNIREARRAVMSLMNLNAFHGEVLAGAQGVLGVEYAERTGHQWDGPYAVEYEAISYVFRIVKREES